VLYVIALVYSLLCVRLRVQLEASFVNGQGSASFSVGAFGVQLRRDFALLWKPPSLAIRAMPRYGKATFPKKNPPRRGHRIRSYLINALRSKQFERVALHLRLGLGDACATAVAAGTVHALACALLAAAGDPRISELRVTPDFAQAGLCAHMTGIFSCRLGDIMLAALRPARRKRKEGLKWTSIPLRA